MTWERKRLARQKVRYNDANDDAPLVYQHVVNGEKVAITSATIAIYAPGGTTALVSGSLTVPDSPNTLNTYAVNTTTVASWPASKGYRADLVVTYNSKTYPRHFLFDVAKYVFVHQVTQDTLVGMNQRVRGMVWDDDEDLSNFITHCADEFQAKIEAKILDAEKMRMEWIADSSSADVAFALFCLSNFFHAFDDHEEGKRYGDRADTILSTVLSTYGFDKGEAGAESTKEGGIQELRLVT